MAQRNKKCDLNPVPPTLECFSTGKLSTNTPSEKALIACDENEVNCLRKKAASRIQLGWRSFILCSSVRRQHSAATKIQTYYRSWLLRKAFVNQKRAVIKIQSMFKCIKCWRDFQQYKIATRSATIIQSYVRAWIARREACRHRCMILMIQVSLFLNLYAMRIQFHCWRIWTISSMFRCFFLYTFSPFRLLSFYLPIFGITIYLVTIGTFIKAEYGFEFLAYVICSSVWYLFNYLQKVTIFKFVICMIYSIVSWFCKLFSNCSLFFSSVSSPHCGKKRRKRSFYLQPPGFEFPSFHFCFHTWIFIYGF